MMLPIFWLWSSFAFALPSMTFRYEPMEGESSPCTFEQIRDLPDWAVTCSTGYGKKRFAAHVIVRENPRPNDTGLEILYWVTDRGDTDSTPPKFHSTSALFRLAGNASLSEFTLSQGVENDFAMLTLGWKK